MTTTTILTPDDIADLPRPAGIRGYELVHGSVRPSPRPDGARRRVREHVFGILTDHVIARRLPGCIMSDVGFVLGLRREPHRMRIADIAYVAPEIFSRHLEPRRALKAVPELVVEIMTCGRTADTAQRMIDFLEAGVKVFWLLDPCAREALVYNAGESGRSLRADEFIDAAPIFPALRIVLSSLFPIG